MMHVKEMYAHQPAVVLQHHHHGERWKADAPSRNLFVERQVRSKTTTKQLPAMRARHYACMWQMCASLVSASKVGSSCVSVVTSFFLFSSGNELSNRP
jgi:hypothetical protein